jgi:hypothetical protein
MLAGYHLLLWKFGPYGIMFINVRYYKRFHCMVIICCEGILGFMRYFNGCHGNVVKAGF